MQGGDQRDRGSLAPSAGYRLVGLPHCQGFREPETTCAKPMPSHRRRFDGRPDQVLLARQFVVNALVEDSPIREVARLLVSEVTTNALRHTSSGTAGGGFRVSDELRDDRLRVEVDDAGARTARSAERMTWRRPAAAGWNWWTRWPVGGAPSEARTGGGLVRAGPRHSPKPGASPIQRCT
jgi:hypothetical protein